VPPRALACPGCGSDAETGWSDPAGIEYLGSLVDVPEAAPEAARGHDRRLWRILGTLLGGLATAGLLVMLMGWSTGIRISALVGVVLLALLVRVGPRAEPGEAG
jgi:predicted lipid-binding transport protein (Tim44 family)